MRNNLCHLRNLRIGFLLCVLLPAAVAAQCTNATPVPNQTVTSGSVSYTDNNALAASSFVVSGSGSATFVAGHCIDLQPGLHATAGTAGTTFHAWVETAPSAVSVSPASGSGLTQQFTWTVSSPSGYGYLSDVFALFNTSVSGLDACYIRYNQASNLLYLADNSASTWSSSTLSNSQCSIGSWSASGTGTQLTLTVSVTFLSSFSGNWNDYLLAQDNAGLTSEWLPVGAWTVPNPAPTVVGISPQSAPVGSGPFSLTVSGTGFVASASYVTWNGSSRTTTYNTSTQLTAVIPASDVTAAGTATVAVVTPAPGGGTSNGATFTISTVPVVSGLSPASIEMMSGAQALTIAGSGFVPSSVVQWNGSNRTTTYVSSTELSAAITSTDVASAGTDAVAVNTPGTGTSSPMNIIVWSCWSSDLTLSWFTQVYRLNGNRVETYSRTTFTGAVAPLWQPGVSATSSFNGVAQANSNGWFWGSQGSGTRDWWDQYTLQTWGPGRYSQSASHDAHTPNCGGWYLSDACGVSSMLGFTCNVSPPWTSTNWGDIYRPARPDYYGNSPTALWYLGPGINADCVGDPAVCYYNARTVLTPGAANGAPENPVWAVTNGASKLSLSCTNCSAGTLPAATATAASGGCQTYDVMVQTSYNGFMSDPFYLFINRPWSLIAANDSEGGTWVYSTNLDDNLQPTNGYNTHVNYQTLGLCTTDPAMRGYDVNEQFGVTVPVYPGHNWPALQPQPGTVPSDKTVWYDEITRYNPGSNPGDPAWCPNVNALCVPQFSNPGVGPHTLVDWTPQQWFIGSILSGSGARVQTDTLQRYTDSGWHTDIVTPRP